MQSNFKSPIKYPDLRRNLIEFIRGLADPVYQQRVWINQEKPAEKFGDNCSMTINFIYDIVDSKNTKNSIGRVLKNNLEADLFDYLFKKLEDFLDDIGPYESDEAALNSEYWPEVVEAARKSYIFLTDGKKPDNTFEELRRKHKPERRILVEK